MCRYNPLHSAATIAANIQTTISYLIHWIFISFISILPHNLPSTRTIYLAFGLSPAHPHSEIATRSTRRGTRTIRTHPGTSHWLECPMVRGSYQITSYIDWSIYVQLPRGGSRVWFPARPYWTQRSNLTRKCLFPSNPRNQTVRSWLVLTYAESFRLPARSSIALKL